MSNSSLLDRIKNGDSSWIELAYKDYRQSFVGWIRKLLKVDDETAADLFQSALLTLYENVQGGQLKELTSSVQTYLFAIGKNKGYEYLAKKNRQQKLSVYEFSLVYTEGSSYEQEMAYEHSTNQLMRVVERLGEPCMPLLRLFYYERKSWEQISGLLGYKTINSAKNMKYKCMQKIKEIMHTTKTDLAHG